MSLPKLEVPTFETTLPSNNKKVKFRPFLVKEHKTLLMMKDSSEDEISRVVEEVVDVCTFNKIKTGSLPSFDLEYLFCKIRAKSVGEKIDLILSCKQCDNKVPFRVDIDELQIQKHKDHQSKFMIDDNVGIEMKYPKFALDLYDLIEQGTDKYFAEIEKCIKAIYTRDGKYTEIGPDDKEELQNFIASMSSEQFAKIEMFFLTIPRLSHVQEVKCDKCGTLNRARVEGISNFFV